MKIPSAFTLNYLGGTLIKIPPEFCIMVCYHVNIIAPYIYLSNPHRGGCDKANLCCPQGRIVCGRG